MSDSQQPGTETSSRQFGTARQRRLCKPLPHLPSIPGPAGNAGGGRPEGGWSCDLRGANGRPPAPALLLHHQNRLL